MSGKTKPLGSLPDNHQPIEHTAPMTDLRALDLAIWALQRRMERIQEDAEWLGIDDAPIRYRCTEVTQALFKLQKIRDSLSGSADNPNRPSHGPAVHTK